MSEAALWTWNEEARPLTVSELTAQIKDVIESRFNRTFLVVGQVSNYKRHSSGHAYFTLKDEAASISCVMWRPYVQALRFVPEDGLEVVATGTVRVYEPQGRYQLYVTQLRPVGLGELEIRFRQLCRRLQKLGWFDERHKKALPPFPTRIGLVTSPTGAAVRDLIRVITSRWPVAELIVVPVRVQGDGAASEIAAAIRWANRRSLCDVLIVGRGGGSKEDLWAFNEEPVARAIFESDIPVVSAVGHEIDYTIADLVADKRAATPSNAGEIVVPDRREVANRLQHLAQRCANALHKGLQTAASRLYGLVQRPVLRAPVDMIRSREQQCDDLEERLVNAATWCLRHARERLDAVQARFGPLTPLHYVEQQQARCQELSHRLRTAVDWTLRHAHRQLDGTESRLLSVTPLARLSSASDAVTVLLSRMHRALEWQLDRCSQLLTQVCTNLESLSPLKVLARGYSLTTKLDGHTVIRSVDQVDVGEAVLTRLHQGQIRCTVTEKSFPDQAVVDNGDQDAETDSLT